MDTVDNILRNGKERRLAEKRREDVIDTFRRNAERSIGSAIIYFVIAIFQGALLWLYLYFPRHKEFGHWDVLEGIYLCGMLCLFLGMAIQKLRVSPRDKLLLLLIKETIKENRPNQASEPTSTEVTSPAGAGDRASGTCGSPER
jgi:hypothetical protein